MLWGGMDDFADFLTGLPHPALVIGADERVLRANTAAEVLFGRGIAGRHHAYELRRPEPLAAIGAALRQGQSSDARLVIPGEGREQVYQMTVWPVGRGAACLFEDMTRSEQAEQMRRDFVANVSHELKTPLTALSGFIETLQGSARNDANARDRFLAIMAREADRMNRLVRDLLHLSRVEAQERQRPESRIDLAGLVATTAATLRPMADRAGVTLEVAPTGLDAPVCADPDQMTQVLTNLIENAVKYGGTGGWVGVSLTKEQGPRGPLARLMVEDRGEGIDPLHLPRLSERFYRVDGHRSREKGGTGLGLAIVKHIAQRHRGRLVIDSAPGKGTRVSILLPLD
jgi:two-component system phosphate regulon sensor histidine kinase PhoR